MTPVAIALSIFLAIGGVIYNLVTKQPPDNPVEEEVETLIKDETGIDIDLTPKSPEK